MKTLLSVVLAAAMLPLQGFAQEQGLSKRELDKMAAEAKVGVCENIAQSRATLGENLIKLKQLRNDLNEAKQGDSDYLRQRALNRVTLGFSAVVGGSLLVIANEGYQYSGATPKQKLFLAVSLTAAAVAGSIAKIHDDLTEDQVEKIEGQILSLETATAGLYNSLMVCQSYAPAQN